MLIDLKSKKGFTYIDVIISFVIFGLLFVVISRLASSTYELMRYSQQSSQMLHIAELEMENYKSGISAIDSFLNHTGFVQTSETMDEEGVIINRQLMHTNIDEKYTVHINESYVSDHLRDIYIDVALNQGDVDPIRIYNRIILEAIEGED